jgi:hypothetical protein
MANLTITVNEEVLKRARLRALQQGTSVNALLRDYLERFAGNSPARQAVEEIEAIARRVHAGSGAGGRKWKRDDVHDR